MYTIYTTKIEGDKTEDLQTETGLRHLKYYYFNTVLEAKEALASGIFEGVLSRDGLSKFFRDDEKQVSYEIWEVGKTSRDRKQMSES